MENNTFALFEAEQNLQWMQESVLCIFVHNKFNALDLYKVFMHR